MLEIASGWRTAYPGASVGVLAMHGVSNPEQHPELERKKEELEQALRARFASENRKSLRALPVLAAYDAYYRKFGKTYHVQHQLESLAFKDKPIPRVAALVEAMFMAELKNLLLTAGHDLDAIEPPLRLDVGSGEVSYVGMNGQEQRVQAGDMLIADRAGVVSCIIYGPDRRTRIRPETVRALFTTYAPPGIAEHAVREHMQDIRDNVRVIAPEASVELLEVIGGG